MNKHLNQIIHVTLYSQAVQLRKSSFHTKWCVNNNRHVSEIALLEVTQLMSEQEAIKVGPTLD